MKIQDYGSCPSDDVLTEYLHGFVSNFKKWQRKKLISTKVSYVLAFSHQAFSFLFKVKNDLVKKDRVLAEKSLAYFIWPNDLILDSLGPIGFTDDTFLLCFVIFLASQRNKTKISINLKSCERIIEGAPSYLGKGVQKQLKEHAFQWSKETQ